MFSLILYRPTIPTNTARDAVFDETNSWCVSRVKKLDVFYSRLTERFVGIIQLDQKFTFDFSRTFRYYFL